MVQPTKHPKSGVYRVRMAIPEHLRETTGRLYGKRTEFIESLGTKEPKEAKRLAPHVVERFQSWLATAGAAYQNRPVTLSEHQLSALCGQWVARKNAEHAETSPDTLTAQEAEIAWLSDVAAALDGDEAYPGNPETDALAAMGEDVDAILAHNGLCADEASRRRLAGFFVRHMTAMRQDAAERKRTGRWRTSVKPEDFATPETPRAPKGVGCTLDVLLERWARDNGHALDARPIARALYDRQRTMERLATFLGHKDALRVTKAEAVAWKDEMQRAGKHASTVRNDLSEMSAIWKAGIKNGLIATNPFEGISPAKAKRKGRAPRAFTDEEACLIWSAARQERGWLRWVPIILCLTGARLSEVCQASKEDIVTQDRVVCLRIHGDGEGQSIKNEDSRRTVPLHPSLIAEGFLDYVATLPDHSPLWPDLAPDSLFGRRGTTGSKRISRWVRDLGLTDPFISPSHSWRHWFINACRKVTMHPEVRSALTGHSAKMDESAAYGDGMTSFIRVLADAMETVRLPEGL